MSLLARFSHNPGRVHWAGVKSIIRYLLQSKEKGLLYHSGNSESVMPSLHGYSDSSFNDTEDGRSTLGYALYLGSSPVSWKLKVSSTIPQSAFEAEWMALNMISREMVWTRDVVMFLSGLTLDPSVIQVDNKACMERLDDRVTDGNKHFRPKYFLVTALEKNGVIRVLKVASENNVADIFTKALGVPSFPRHVVSLSVA